MPLQLALPKVLPRAGENFITVPYDLYCNSIHSQLNSRICPKCGIYHDSQKSKKQHEKVCKVDTYVDIAPRRVRPVRIAAIRQRELMCVIKYSENVEDIEWLDEEEVDSTGLLQLSKSGSTRDI